MKVYLCYWASDDWNGEIDIGVEAAFLSKEKAEDYVKRNISNFGHIYLSIEEVEVEE